MVGIVLDLTKLLGFKVTLRALQAAKQAGHQPPDAEGGTLDYSAILRSRIGSKPLEGLRFRRQ